MHNLELDNEIIITKQAIKELEDSGDFNAAKIARADLAFLISQLSN